MDSKLMTHVGATKVTRQELSLVPTPPATDTFKPIAHAALVDELEGSLSFRHIRIARDEYAVSPDGMRLFGLLELDAEYEGVRFAIGLRNANDKSMRLGMVAVASDHAEAQRQVNAPRHGRWLPRFRVRQHGALGRLQAAARQAHETLRSGRVAFHRRGQDSAGLSAAEGCDCLQARLQAPRRGGAFHDLPRIHGESF